MLNEIRNDRPADARFFPCPASIVSGQPVLIGALAGVALDSYNPNSGGTVFRLAGSYALTVVGQSAESPVVNAQINPGDKIYATGTLDATTNVTYNLTLDKNSSNTLFGSLDDVKILAGVTNTAAIVKLKEAA